MTLPLGIFKKPIVILSVLLFIAVIFIPFATPAGLFDDLGWNTDGELWIKRGLQFGVQFDSANVIGTWQSDADSELFTITGFARKDSFTGAGFKEYRYALYAEGNTVPVKRYPSDSSWILFPFTIGDTSAWRYLEPWTTSVRTNGDARIRIVMEVIISDFGLHTYSDPTDLPWDGANVFSGAASIYLPATEIAKSPFEAGETINVYYDTGFTGGLTWSIWYRPPRDRIDLPQTVTVVKENIGDNKRSFISITVGDDWFKVGSSNDWSIELWNPYFERAETTALMIDDRERAPIIADVSYVNNGDSFTYTVMVEETYAGTSHINVDSWYSYGGGTTKPGISDTESWISNDVYYSISGSSVTFTVYPKSNIDGYIVVEIVAYDIDGRPSTPDYQSFSVSGGITEPEDPPYEQPFVWTTSAVIIAVMVILGIIAIMWFAPVPLNIKIILCMIIGIAGAILVWLFGTLQLGG